MIGPQAAKSDAWLAFSDHRDGVFACFIFFKPEGGLEGLKSWMVMMVCCKSLVCFGMAST